MDYWKKKKIETKGFGGWWDSFALDSIRCWQYLLHSIGNELKKNYNASKPISLTHCPTSHLVRSNVIDLRDPMVHN